MIKLNNQPCKRKNISNNYNDENTNTRDDEIEQSILQYNDNIKRNFMGNI